MKKKNCILSFVLGILCVLSAFTFTGCSNQIDALKTNFQSLETAYQSYESSFTNGSVGGFFTNYKLDYGSIVNASIETNSQGFEDLDDVYNIILAISNEYIDSNKEFLLNYNAKNLSKKAENALKTLNDNIKSYQKELKTFIDAKQSMVYYFEQYGVDNALGDNSKSYHLRVYKKAFANFLGKNIAVSLSLAKAIECTEIFDLLKTTTTTNTDIGIVRGYIQAKTLAIFNEFLINQTSSVMNWSLYRGLNDRLDSIYDNYNSAFSQYKTLIVNGGTNYRAFANGEMETFLDKINNFFLAAEDYYKAVKDVNFSELAKNYDNDLNRYSSAKKMIFVDIEKLEQFVSTTLPGFIGEVVQYIY